MSCRCRSDYLDALCEMYPGRGRIICLDTETTGLDAQGGDEILQLAAADVVTGEVLYNSFLWPAHNKSWPEAEAVNRITPEMVRDAPSMCDEREKIQEIIDRAAVIVGYNIGFDLGFLEAGGITDGETEWVIDVMLDYAAHVGDYHDWCGGYRWQKLTDAARATGYSGHDAHHALGDVMATIHVAKWLQEHPKKMAEHYRQLADLEFWGW